MPFTDIFVVASFFLFDILYFLRTLFVHSMNIQVWMMGKNTNNAFEKALEFAAMPLVLVYDLLVLLQAFRIYIHPVFAYEVLHIFWLRYIGVALCALSLVLLLLVLFTIFTAPDDNARKYILDGLITNGIYVYTRNPVFMAMIVYATGIAFIYPIIPALVSVILVWFGVHVHILAEEKYLLFKCGERYTEYMKRTKRYIIV